MSDVVSIRGPVSAGRRRPAPVASGARNQLADAQRCLAQAMAATDLADRYVAAHLGALRGAAAILAMRPHPTSRTLKNASAWVQLEKVAPEYADWATYFAAGSAKRKAAEAGITRLITTDEVDQLIRQTADFLDLVASSLRAAA